MTTGKMPSATEFEAERLLTLSHNIYLAMERVYLLLDQQQLTHTDQVAPLLQQLEELKEKALQADSKVMRCLQRSGVSEKASSTMEARRETIKRLIELNEKLTKSTECYKAVIQNELSNLYRNRNALSGYKTAQEKTGSISISS